MQKVKMLFLLLVFVFTSSNLFGQTNLIKNGDFESNTTNPWIPWLLNDRDEHIIELVDTDLKVGDEKACKISRREDKSSMLVGLDSVALINSGINGKKFRISFDFQNLDDTTHLKSVYPTLKIELNDGSSIYKDGEKAIKPENQFWYHYSEEIGFSADEVDVKSINWASDKTFLLLQLDSDRIWNGGKENPDWGKRVPVLIDNVFFGSVESLEPDSLYKYQKRIN